jgi:WD40 repeat protein
VSAAFSPDGKHIVATSGDKYAHIWDIATTTETGVLRGHDDFVNSAVFSPDGSRIVTASADKTARILDAAIAKELAVLRGHENIVNSAAFSPNGSRIVTASQDHTSRIWDAATGTKSRCCAGMTTPFCPPPLARMDSALSRRHRTKLLASGTPQQQPK